MKHNVAIVDSNSQHRSTVAEALLTIYETQSYGNAANAISGILVKQPKVIIVGQQVGAGSGTSFIRELRREKALASIPVVFVADNEDFRTLDILREFAIKDYLVKPYRRSALLSLISNQVNGEVERTWQDLPLSQRKALEGSLGVFNSLADDIANGNPIPMAAVNDSCSALLEVISNGELGSLLNKIKDHDNFIYVHSLRFSTFIALFAKSIGLPKPQQVMVATGGMLHDIGMMSIPRETLNRQGKLSPSEMQMIRNHVAVSQKVLEATKAVPKGVMMIATQDHERLDGSGYPAGLKGSELNDLARMAAVIDVFCALTDRRPYRRTVPPHVALETMATEMKNQLDQELLYKFKEILLDSTDLSDDGHS